jgi:hypothetical protein
MADGVPAPASNEPPAALPQCFDLDEIMSLPDAFFEYCKEFPVDAAEAFRRAPGSDPGDIAEDLDSGLHIRAVAVAAAEELAACSDAVTDSGLGIGFICRTCKSFRG